MGKHWQAHVSCTRLMHGQRRAWELLEAVEDQSHPELKSSKCWDPLETS